jgi:hypothetical protein
MTEPETILEDVSPAGNVYALVEQSETCCYFYLQGPPNSTFGLKSCWVRNFKQAPEHLDVEAMRRGESPMLALAQCRHPEGASGFANGELKIIWAEEGDAAALSKEGEILTVIPSWSGQKGFHGYSRDCIGESDLCWELGAPAQNAQFAKYERASKFWNLWSDGRNPWPQWRDQISNVVESKLGTHSNYYAIDGGKWPPKAMLRIPSEQKVTLITVGICIRPQPRVEMFVKDPENHCRIELAISLEASLPDAAIKSMAGYLSGQAEFPWNNFTFLGRGHTIPADAARELSNGRLPFVLLVTHDLETPLIQLPRILDDPINVLWLIPISDRERKFAEVHGSDELISQLKHAGVNYLADFGRKSVV